MKDYFEYLDEVPNNVRLVLDKFLWKDGVGYNDCAELVQDLNQVGWTCEYGLDADPYNLQPLPARKKYGYEDMAHLAFALHFL